MRDLGPLSRKFADNCSTTDDDIETKAIQETILNHFLEIDPTAKNINDEFLLSLSGLVPLDSLMRRLQSVRGVNFHPYVDLTEYKTAITKRVGDFLSDQNIDFNENDNQAPLDALNKDKIKQLEEIEKNPLEFLLADSSSDDEDYNNMI